MKKPQAAHKPAQQAKSSKAKASAGSSNKAAKAHKIHFGTQVSRRLLVSVVLVASLAVITLGWLGIRAWNTAQVAARFDRIEAIYADFNLDQDQYQLQSSNVFGDKRPYEGGQAGEGRTFSSSKQYQRGTTVSEAVADLDGKIKAAGFTYFEEPYPGSVNKQLHYKSTKGEYVRLSVSSKPYDDAWRNAALMGLSVPANLETIDTNAGPVNVTIKVNLDDNNE